MAGHIRKKYPDTPGVIWHVEAISILEKLNPTQRDRVFMDSLYYRQCGIIPDYSDDPVLDMFWAQHRQRMDYDEAGFYNTAISGKYGGLYGQYKKRAEAEGKDVLTFQSFMETFYPDAEL